MEYYNLNKQFLKYPYLIILGLFLFSFNSEGQISNPPVDTGKANSIRILQSDRLEYEVFDDRDEKRLIGDVKLQHKDAFMYCDSAVTYENTIRAYEEVVMEQGNSKTFSDYLQYNGAQRTSVLVGDVILVDPPNKLETQRLDYNLETKDAVYRTGAVMTNDKTTLKSTIGYYNTETKIASFKDSVHVVDQNFVLDADTLVYDANTNISYFHGPTLIRTQENTIYCESGFFDTEKNKAEFIGNAWIQKKDGERAEADKIVYDGETNTAELLGKSVVERDNQFIYADNSYFDSGQNEYIFVDNVQAIDGDRIIYADSLTYSTETNVGVAVGGVVVKDSIQTVFADKMVYNRETRDTELTGEVYWVDTIKNMTIECEKAYFNDSTSYLKAIGRPLMSIMIEDDTLFLAADTITSTTDSLDGEAQAFVAQNKVRVYKSDMQAVCELLEYSQRDSVFRFFDDPVLWSDSTQFIADTIYMFMKDGGMDKLELLENSLILNTPDEKYFNQIKGDNIYSFFKNGELDNMDVKGNGEVIYYIIEDDKSYMGVNVVQCGFMLVLFGNNEVEKIKFYQQPEATIYPMGQVNHSTLRLENFVWHSGLRPLNSWTIRYPKEKDPKTKDSTENDLDSEDPKAVDPKALGLPDTQQEIGPKTQDTETENPKTEDSEDLKTED